jgi:nicotinamide mononucleotide (NMN) deamidase PncC
LHGWQTLGAAFRSARRGEQSPRQLRDLHEGKQECALGVPARLLAQEGAVCCAVAAEMAQGALARSPADLAVSITGVAGPDPDEDDNPVGRPQQRSLIWIANT